MRQEKFLGGKLLEKSTASLLPSQRRRPLRKPSRQPDGGPHGTVSPKEQGAVRSSSMC